MDQDLLLKEEFIIKDIDKEGKKFSSISRIESTAKNKEIDIIFDINSDLFLIESTNYELCFLKWHNNRNHNHFIINFKQPIRKIKN